MKSSKQILLSLLVLPIYLISCGTEEVHLIEEVPSEFLSSRAASLELLEHQDWIILTLTPVAGYSGQESSGTPTSLSFSVNDFEVDIATTGLTRNAVIDQIVARVNEVEEFQALVNYPAGRVLILSAERIGRSSSHARGYFKIRWESMGD
jgi:hypothetical protein